MAWYCCNFTIKVDDFAWNEDSTKSMRYANPKFLGIRFFGIKNIHFRFGHFSRNGWGAFSFSFSEYLDSSKILLVPHSGQKHRLHEIWITENGTFCNFYYKYESFMRYLNNFKPGKFTQLLTKFVMNEKIAKNWHKIIIRRFYGTIDIAEKLFSFWSFGYFDLLILSLFYFSFTSQVLLGKITWNLRNRVNGQ